MKGNSVPIYIIFSRKAVMKLIECRTEFLQVVNHWEYSVWGCLIALNCWSIADPTRLTFENGSETQSGEKIAE